MQVLLFLAVLVAGIAWLSAEFSGRQPRTVALDVGISVVRILGVLLVLSWVQETVGKDVERKTVYFVLSYPVGRTLYLGGRYLGIVFLTAAAVTLFSLGLLLADWLVSLQGYQQSTPVHLGMGFVLTMALVMLDLIVVSAFGIFVASFSVTPFLPFFLGLAFALSARMLGPVMSYLSAGKYGAEELAPVYMPLLNVFNWALPDLSRLDIRNIVLYGTAPAESVVILAVLHAAAYATFLLGLAFFVFRRREFA